MHSETYICNVSMALVSRLYVADYPDTQTFILYAVICTKVCIKISLVLQMEKQREIKVIKGLSMYVFIYLSIILICRRLTKRRQDKW